MTDEESLKVVNRISLVSILANVFLAILKFTAGILGHSAAMLSDAVHTLSDVFSTIVVLIGYRLSRKKQDKNHPYGHERLECVAAIILATMLFVVGCGIGWTGINAIINKTAVTTPAIMALWAAVLSIIIKEAMYWYTRFGAKKIDSGVLMADAWHHRSDSLSSIGAFIGILGARLGYPILDPIASVIICIFILKAAFDIFRDAVNKMVDASCDETTIKSMKEVIRATPNVITVDLLQTRLFGDKIYVDVEISCNAAMSLEESHAVAEEVHNNLEEAFPKVKHCMVHVNPCSATN